MDLVDGLIASPEVIKNEAIERMKVLGMLSDTITKFEQGKLQMSENGILFDADEKITAFAKKHGENYGELIYHVIHSFSNLGETYEYCFVSRYLEDWEYERNLIRRNIVYCYVDNKTIPDHSEAGSILVENYHGALLRIG